MCCLRYEDATYEELSKRLPKNKTRVGTAEGPGIVVDSKILVQLVLVRLDPPPGAFPGEFGREIAVPVEELMDPDACPAPGEVKAPDPMRGMSQRSVREKLAAERNAKLAKQDRYREKAGGPAAPATGSTSPTAAEGADEADGDGGGEAGGEGAGNKRKRRRKRKKRGGEPGEASAESGDSTPLRGERVRGGEPPRAMRAEIAGGDDDDAGRPSDESSGDEEGGTDAASEGSDAGSDGGDGTPRKRRRRRRRRGGNRGGGPEGGSGGGGSPPSA